MSHAPDTPAHDPWADLNPRQREAVEYGTGADAGLCGPLLVIAGAGSGKTSTLAHRVANLVLKGVDPHRILLLTFSRRAAIEMERRAGRVMQAVLGMGGQPPSLPWSGTFHAVGARLLRDYAPRIGLSEAFTIHDRGDAEDLMASRGTNWGFPAPSPAFP